MSKRLKFILVVGLQILVILGIVVLKLGVITGGTEVLLEIEPVDPRSPLRGDYVTFQYEISELDSDLLTEASANYGETVYVVLRQGDKYWHAKRVEKTKPEDGVFIQGKLTGRTKGFSQSYNNSLEIEYGIEEYFIPEDEGREADFFDKEIAAKVALGDSGNPVIEQVYLEGEPWP